MNSPAKEPQPTLDALGRLIHPIEKSRFLEETFGKRSTHIRRSDPRYFDYLIGLRDIDEAINLHGLRQADISMVNRGQKVDPALYLDGRGVVNPASVLGRHAMGATIALNGFETHHPRLLDLISEIEEETGTIVGANVYITPRSSQGFQAHFDIQDVFVLQISGAKKWRLFGEGLRDPIHGHAKDSHRVAPTAIGEEILLEPGDLLYLPRGFIHEALTHEMHSVHVTVGLFPFNWADVISGAVHLALLDHEELRGSVPREIIFGQGGESMGSHILNGLSHALAQGDYMTKAVDQLRQRFAARRRSSFIGHLETLCSSGQIISGRRFRLRNRVSIRVAPKGGQDFALLFEGSELQLSKGHIEAVRWIQEREVFTLDEVKAEVPTAAIDELLQTLFSLGILVPTEDGAF